jgi:hypothetical protein
VSLLKPTTLQIAKQRRRKPFLFFSSNLFELQDQMVAVKKPMNTYTGGLNKVAGEGGNWGKFESLPNEKVKLCRTRLF